MIPLGRIPLLMDDWVCAASKDVVVFLTPRFAEIVLAVLDATIVASMAVAFALKVAPAGGCEFKSSNDSDVGTSSTRLEDSLGSSTGTVLAFVARMEAV